MDDINEAILLAGYIAAGLSIDPSNFFELSAEQHIQELIKTNTRYDFNWIAVYDLACNYIETQIDKKKLTIEKEMAKHRAGKAMAAMAIKLFKPYEEHFK